jgi:diamine N-acetyltransferase
VRVVRLEPVTPENYEAALAVTVRPDQEDLVAPVVTSLAEAYVYAEHAWPRLIYDGDRPVGFLMAFLDIAWPAPGDAAARRSGLWRLNIAAGAQGAGYGRFAVTEVRSLLTARGIPRIVRASTRSAGQPDLGAPPGRPGAVLPQARLPPDRRAQRRPDRRRARTLTPCRRAGPACCQFSKSSGGDPSGVVRHGRPGGFIPSS